MLKQKKYYFDYAATTPVDKRVVKAMQPYQSEIFGNPGSLHKFGQEASAAVFKARNKISKLINCNYREVIFTGSATEANSLALRGTLKALIQNFPPKADPPLAEKIPRLPAGRKDQNDNLKFKNFRPRIITSQIEHGSVLETCRDLEKEGVEVIYLPVSKSGIVDLKKLKESLNKRTVLVSIMYANNEVGSIQPIKEIAEIIREFKIIRHCESRLYRGSSIALQSGESATRQFLKTDRLLQMPRNDRFIHNSPFPLFHTDAAQAFNYLNCDIKELAKSAKGGSPEHFAERNVLEGVDMMTLSSQKIYGPKGVGLLYIKNFGTIGGVKFISPIITGGGQEEGLRAGTENVAGIVGMSEAAQITFDLRKKESQRLSKLQNYFISRVKKIFPKVLLNGPVIGTERLPNNINIYFPPNPAAGRASNKKDLIFKLDMAGFAVSGGSACSARLAKPSHVLKAMGCSDEKASESIRISFGRQTTRQEIDKLLMALKFNKNIKS